MKHNALWLLGLAAVTALVVAGCGGGGDDSTSTSSLAKPAWIAKADAICQQGNQEIEQAANEQFGKQDQEPTDAQIQQFTNESVVPSVQRQIDQIRDLGAPSGDEDQVNKILDTVQADIDKAKSATTLPDDPFADGNALATQYGLKVCGQS
jgi:hypothetical protein